MRVPSTRFPYVKAITHTTFPLALIMSGNGWPLFWVNKTFTSRARTEELLKPELENSNLSYADYEKAIEFLPGRHRHYQVCI